MSDITIKNRKNDMPTEDNCFYIDENSYRNNVAKGTATVNIVGKGDYSGTVRLKFSIVAKEITWWELLLGK